MGGEISIAVIEGSGRGCTAKLSVLTFCGFFFFFWERLGLDECGGLSRH